MSASSIGAGKAGGYARYLEGKTVAPERGDYQLTPDGVLTEARGRWLSDGKTLERLGVDPGEPVVGGDFVAVMEGQDPQTGRWLRPAGADGSRGGGIDVTFSAPKSVSVVWALADPWQRERLQAAHERAVARTVGYLRERVPVVRRRYEGQVVEELAKDVLATAYLHTTARGVFGARAPDPQLHTHVVITGAVREDDRFVAVASRTIFRAGRELGAFYRSALADELIEQGYTVEAGTGTNGRYFELAGVPGGLCEALSSRRREIVRATERFRAKHGRAPERRELRELALENRRAKELTTRGDLQRVWGRAGAEHDFGPVEAVRLVGKGERPARGRPAADRIEGKLAERDAIFEPTALRAVALEQTVGELLPEQALGVARAMVGERRVLTLEGGRMTTLQVRAQEQAIERRAAQLARQADREVGDVARELASEQVAERIGAPLSVEQQTALRALTGPERLAVLVGPAGTGKGVVIDAVARSQQTIGRETIGVAVAGSTAERLGADSPGLAGATMTIDALVARARRGSVHVGPDTTVILDEGGMVDHKRMDALTNLIDRSGAKLVAVGDGRQLPSIGPGGMFDRLAGRARTVELGEIHRTSDPDERKAWAALRADEPERAMAHYRARGRLHFSDTREQAGERAVKDWARLIDELDPRQVAIIADASSVEIDRLSARAQHLRHQRGELGPREIQLPSRHYGLREGDLITLTATHKRPGTTRVENGARGEITTIDHWQHSITARIEGSDRDIYLAGQDLEHVRLAYAQHVYRQQGATVERAIIITGGWQTSRESAYVQASRARHGSDWYIAREELGQDTRDELRIEQLAQKMRATRSQIPSIEHREIYQLERHRWIERSLAPSLSPGRIARQNQDRTTDRTR
ncbi:MAG TPA: MobF family relaxase [Solirubrobacteraceae bacterium]|nr:MobF family relaxase [Solirubrobacteraceae bacterium]